MYLPRAGEAMKIFINYRRADSADVSGRIYDRLVEEYGVDSIFKDVDSIPFGIDFREYLDNSVKECDLLLVVIGNKWLKILDEEGNRRIDNESDFVRIEIESALKREKPVIPLFVHNASPPDMDLLPKGLKNLAYRNGLPIRSDPDFHFDMNRLISGINELFNFEEPKEKIPNLQYSKPDQDLSGFEKNEEKSTRTLSNQQTMPQWTRWLSIVVLIVITVGIISLGINSLLSQGTPSVPRENGNTSMGDETSIPTRTETQVSSQPKLDEPNNNMEDPTKTVPPTKTNAPVPIEAMYTAKMDINCRDGPSTDTEQHWQLVPGQTVPALARWTNGWIVVAIDDPGTRTKCCWVNGDSSYGSLNVPMNNLELIDYLPDRIFCDLRD